MVFGGCFSGELIPDGVVVGGELTAVLGGIECVGKGEALAEWKVVDDAADGGAR